MRTYSLQAIAAAAVVLLAGCSGGGSSSIAPSPGSVGQSAHQATSRSTSLLPAKFQSRNVHSNHGVTFNACPATGVLVYLSDAALGVINIYKGGTTMCGQLSGFSEPQGITVHGHDLYIADTLNGRVEGYHRGATSPFQTYTDPGVQYPVDVAIAPDGTVIASNIFQQNGGPGSLSTFKSSGTFVGNFVLTNMLESFFVTAFASGVVYDDGFDTAAAGGAIWKLKCPAGHCTAATELGVPLVFPGGLGENNTKDLVASDQSGNTGDTFELPSLSPATFTLNGGDNVTVALNKTNSKWFAADALNNALVCYKYAQNGSSSGTCGTVAGNSGGQALGVAVDPAGL
jgi:hypothetical protein